MKENFNPIHKTENHCGFIGVSIIELPPAAIRSEGQT
jgi:hypothetical protein